MLTPKSLHYILLAAAIALVFPACGGKKTAAEAAALELKNRQEAQKVKAAIYYQKLIDTYPDSPYTEQARARLQALGPVATPKPVAKGK